MILAHMAAQYPEELTCDMAETYHVLDWRALGLPLAATLAAGLRDGELKTYPLLIKKKTGELLLSADTAWVAKMPNSDFGKSGGTRQWVIYTAESERGDV